MLQLEIVLDDSVMYDDNFARAVAMRMRILFGWAPVSGPACVADSVETLERSRANGFFEVAKLSRRAANLQFAVLIHHGDARGIVAAIFKPLQPVENEGNDAFLPDVTHNSAHEILLLGAATQRTHLDCA